MLFRSEGGSQADVREAVEMSLRAHFLPEFLNRIDETIIFHPLDAKDLRQIAQLQIERLRKQLAQHDLKLEVTPAAIDQVAKAGYDPVYGARPLKRVIQQQMQNPLATELLKGELTPETGVRIDYRDGEFIFERMETPQAVATEG